MRVLPSRRLPCGGVHRVWELRCDCGRVAAVRLSNLFSRSRPTMSCGCLLEEKIRAHGMTRTRTYNSWSSMYNRCVNTRCRSYKKYGAVGLTLCEKWETFEGFLEDMGLRPPGCSIDRVDNTKGYFKENCRWATPREQSANRTVTLVITYLGRSQPLTAWCRELGIPYGRTWRRLRTGRSPEDVFTAPSTRGLNRRRRGCIS